MNWGLKMHKLRYSLVTKAPVVISSNSGSTYMMESLNTIPGSTLIGVFASKFIKKFKPVEPHKDDCFYKWFLNGNLIFSNAVPILENKKSIKTPFCFRLGKNDNSLINLYEDKTENKTESFDTFVVKDQDCLLEDNTSKTLNFHHARNRDTGTAKDGDFFAYESIDKGSKFCFEIKGDEDALKDFKEKFEENFSAYIGKSKTAEYGECEIKILSKKPEPVSCRFKNNEELICVLQSDAIILNKNGFPSTNISDFVREAGIKLVKKKISYIKPDFNEKFKAVWGMKTPSEISFKAGSCFVVKVDKKSTKRLQKIYKEGIGENRHEGFGAVDFISVNEYDPKTQICSCKKEVPIKPAGSVPKLTKDIIKFTLKENLLEKIRLKALEKSDAFFEASQKNGKLISSSLCSNFQVWAFNKIVKDRLEDYESGSRKDTETAKSIKNLYCNNKSLLAHLKDKIVSLKEPNFTEIEGYTFLNDLDDSELETEISSEDFIKLYMTTFFSNMRKKINQKESSDDV